MNNIKDIEVYSMALKILTIMVAASLCIIIILFLFGKDLDGEWSYTGLVAGLVKEFEAKGEEVDLIGELKEKQVELKEDLISGPEYFTEKSEKEEIEQNQEMVSEETTETKDPYKPESPEPEESETIVEETVEKDEITAKKEPDVGQRINHDQSLNKYVLDIIETYQIGGGRYPYLLNKDYDNYNGVTTTLSYQGRVLLKAHPSGNRASHCVGITFEVFFKAMQERNRQLGIPIDDFNGMNWDDLFDFVLNWFAASGSKQTSNIAVAVERYGIGKRLYRLEDVRPGDFIDLNRENNTGHTVVFINWIKEGDRIIGLRYWSSQPSTGGINYNEEYFNVVGYGKVVKDQMYIVRILPVSQYKSL